MLEKSLEEKRPEPVGYKEDQYDQHGNSVNSNKKRYGLSGPGNIGEGSNLGGEQPDNGTGRRI